MKDMGEACSCRALVKPLREGAVAKEWGWSGENREDETGESTSAAVAVARRRVARWCSSRARRCAADRATSAAAKKGSEAAPAKFASGVRARAACRPLKVENCEDILLGHHGMSLK